MNQTRDFTSDWTFRNIIHTNLTANVGRSGTKRHRISVGIEASTRSGQEGKLIAFGSSTFCGSQRGWSSAHSFQLGDLDNVTCEKCLARSMSETAPASELLEVVHGKIVVQSDVRILPRTEA